MIMKKLLVENDLYSCSDLALTATLAIFFPIKQINKSDPRRAQFIFTRSNKLDEFINKYWNKEVLIEPRQYFDQLKIIKARLYENNRVINY